MAVVSLVTKVNIIVVHFAFFLHRFLKYKENMFSLIRVTLRKIFFQYERFFFKMMTFLTYLHFKNNHTVPGKICIFYCRNCL